MQDRARQALGHSLNKRPEPSPAASDPPWRPCRLRFPCRCPICRPFRPRSWTGSSGDIPGFEMLPDRPPQGLLRRFITTQRHLIALAFGALVAHAREGQAFGTGRRLPAAVLAGAPARLPGAAVPRPRDRRPAVPGAAPAAAGDPRARPTSSSARCWPCARTSCRRRSPTSSRTCSTGCRSSPSTATCGSSRRTPRGRSPRCTPGSIPSPPARRRSPRSTAPHARGGLGDHQGGQAGDPRDADPRRHPAARARRHPAALPAALPAVAAHPRVRGIHPPRGRPAAGGGQRRVVHRQLPRPAGGDVPHDLPAVQQPWRALHGVPRRLQAGRAGDARA